MSQKVGRQLPRYEVDRRLDLAATLITHARWWLAGVLLFMCLPLLRVFVFCGASVAIIPLFAFTMSQPLDDMAEAVRNRQAKPLILSMIISGLVLALLLMLQVAALIWLFQNLREAVDDVAAGVVANLLVLIMVSGIAWTLWVYVRAWKGIRSLQELAIPAFPVATSDTPPTPTVLPPRPKR